MNLLEAKGRIAEALVESIFRRARYDVDAYRATDGPGRRARDDVAPDFRVVLPARDGADERRERLVAVRYRTSIDQFLSVGTQRGARSRFAVARRQWPELLVVLVTERPERGRSCFQALALDALEAGQPLRTLDLDDVDELQLYAHNIADHDELVRRIFAMLTAA
jgi:hypothetical protein